MKSSRESGQMRMSPLFRLLARCAWLARVSSAFAFLYLAAGPLSVDAAERVTRDLLALYTFERPTDDVIRDRSGSGDAPHLRIEKAEGIAFRGGRLIVTSSAKVSSAEPTRKIVAAVTESNALSLEAWAKPNGTRQAGPARIVSLSADTLEQSTVEVARWDVHEFSTTGRAQVANPFRDAALVGEFVSPSGRKTVIDGFYDGGDTWRLRFAPSEQGEWSYLLRGEGVEILQRGKLRCTAPRGHGFVRVHPENPYAFAYADGTPFFPMGDTCYGLFDDSPITPALREDYLKTRRSQRFNFVRMTVGHSEARAAADADYWAWGGTAQKPDLDRLNPVFFRRLDGLFSDLRARGMNIELILLNFYRRPFTDTDAWTPARERHW